MPLDMSCTGHRAPLWRRLVESQAPAGASVRVPLSFSCVVVPPPVPAAQPRFEAHIASLVQHVQPLTFMTVTSRIPYLPATASSTTLSPTQAAIAHVAGAVQRCPGSKGAAVVLTLTGTMPAAPGEAPGLTQAGLTRVLDDFLGRAAHADEQAQAAWVGRSRAGLLSMRGVDQGFTRRQWAAQHPVASPSPPRSPLVDPYGAFKDGASLLEAVLRVASRSALQTAAPACAAVAEDPLTVLVPGFPEGHMMHRLWTCSEDEARGVDVMTCDAEESDAPHLSALKRRAFQFLDSLGASLAATAVPYHSTEAGQISGEALAETLRKLIARTETALALGTVPAYLSPATLQAEVDELVGDKLLPIAVGPHSPDTTAAAGAGAGGASGTPAPRYARAPVVVTQTILDPHVFIAYADLVRKTFRDAVAKLGATPATSVVDVVVLPGVLSPQRGEDFTRTVLQLCVRTATPAVQELLKAYRSDLAAALQMWEQSSPGDEAALKAIHARKEKAEDDFQSRMEALTLNVCETLIEAGYGHMYFSAFAYGCGEALGHVVARLQAKHARGPTTVKHNL